MYLSSPSYLLNQLSIEDVFFFRQPLPDDLLHVRDQALIVWEDKMLLNQR